MYTRVCMIGHFGGKEKFTDGQTVKTITLERALRTYASGQLKLWRVDTYDFRHNPIRFLTKLLCGIVACNRIIICISKNGRKIFFPLMYYVHRLLGKKVYHCAIGGRLADEAAANKNYRRYISVFQKNWVESHDVASRLLELGVDNAAYLPNFKQLTSLKPDQLCKQIRKPFRFCTFSRVMAEKGIGDAIQAVSELNREAGAEIATLDIYGPIQENYTQELEQDLEKSGGAAHYCGVVEPDKSVETLMRYDMLLFPTHWRREGIPGTIIDALSAGLPIIARKWRYCDEMLQHGATGYCYDFDHPEELKIWMKKALENPEQILEMKKQCLQAASAYQPDAVVPTIVQELLGGQKNELRIST